MLARYYMYHRETDEVCKEITDKLREHGIQVDSSSGQIYYDGHYALKLKCHELYLLRHGETYGTQSKRFMSDTSSNAKLTACGWKELQKTAQQIYRMNFEYIFYSEIPRVQETFEVIYHQIGESAHCEKIPWMLGIDNAGWEMRNKEELTDVDAEDFYQREVLHNIFAKSSRGCCWGKVLCRCIRLVEYLNEKCAGKKVLLVSQGSISMGLKIVLHMENKPWEKYDSETFFALKNIEQHDYGKLQLICRSDDCYTA